MARLVSGGACFALIVTMLACGGEDNAAPPPQNDARTAKARPSGNGACGLMMQGEVDELFGTAIGAGVDETLDGGVAICSWPSGEDPALLLQLSPGSSDVRAAVALGDGYDVVDIPEMSGPAAAAVEQSERPGKVIVFAVATRDKIVTISPVGLGITQDSARFDSLKKLLDQIATRS